MSDIEDPELEDVRGWYIDGRRVHNPFAGNATLVAPFDRWLAAHDEQVRAAVIENLPGWLFTHRRREAKIAWDKWREASGALAHEEMTVEFEAGFTLGVGAYRNAIRATPAEQKESK